MLMKIRYKNFHQIYQPAQKWLAINKPAKTANEPSNGLELALAGAGWSYSKVCMFVTDLSKITCKAYNIQSKKEWEPKFLPTTIT